MPVSTTVCTQADHGVLTQLKKQQRHSVSSLTTRYVRTHTDGHLAFMEGQEENMQTARPKYAVHTSCHVKNVNGILASKIDNLLLPLALQPIVGFRLSGTMPLNISLSITNCPSSHSHHLNISLYFISPSFPRQNRQYFFQKQFISINC